MEEEFKKSHSLLASIIENQEDIIVFSIDKNYRYLYFNKAHSNRMKSMYNSDIELGMNILDCISTENDLNNTKENYDRALLGESHTNCNEFDEFGIVYFENFFNPIIANDEIIGMSCLSKNITKQKQTERDSERANKKLETILEAIPDLMFEVGLDGRIYNYHSDRTDLLATSPEFFLGKFFKEFVPTEVSTICMNAIIEANEKGWSGGQQYSLDLKTGKHWFELSVSLINDSSLKDRHFILLARDITKRKKAEKIQTDSLNLIQKITSRVPGVVYQFKMSPDGTYCFPYASDGIKQIYDVDPDEVREDASKVFEIIHPDDFAEILASVQESAKNLTPWKQEYRVKFKNGTIRNAYGTATPQQEKDGSILWHGFITDITEKKIIEEKLIANEEFLNQTQIIAKLGSYCLEINTEKWTSSPVLNTIFGIDTDFDKTIENWEKIVHPQWRTTMNNHLVNDVFSKKNKFNKEYKIIKMDTQEERWVHGMGELVYNDLGKPIKLIGTIQDITERKKTEEALRESEEKYRSLVENSPDAVVIYSDGKIVFVNEEGLRMIGATHKDEIIGKPVLQFIHPDNMESVIQRMIDVLRDSNASDIVEEKFIDINRKAIDVEIKAIPTVYDQKDAVQVIIHDITERKKTQEKIKQLSQAVEQSPVSIIITNISGAIEYVNPKFSETSGYSFDEVVGHNPRILKSGHTSKNEYKDLWKTLNMGNEWHGEFHNIKKNGGFYWESASISPIINTQGTITHYIAIKEDITERKNVEKELIKAKEKAEESDRLKLAFLANMSHEIRTPMNGILGFTELLKTPNLTGEEQQEYVSIIEKSGIRMLNIINDIISISKVESGQVEVTLSETNINEQIEYLFTFFKPEASQKGIHLFIKNGLPFDKALINTDREKVYAILTNLVKNAIKFTDSGSIEFGYIKKENHLEFCVTDTGLGISDYHKKIIFERFRQANDSISRSHEGSGLGLAISKAYVEILGGKIWVQSKEGKGSSFYFTLPFDTKVDATNKITSKKVIEQEKKENNIKNLKVLIVEDDPISKLLITIAVKPFSNEILKVSTGIEAVETCRNNPDIDLVMMDINMPEMGGYEATEQIREFNKNLVIIAQTANGMQSDRDEAIAAGCTDYISKPVNIAALSELIHKYFKK